MWSDLTFGFQVRLVVAGGLNLLFFLLGLDWVARYSTEEAEAWKHFWLAGASFLVLVLLWPILRRGNAYLRLGSGLLAIPPIWVLFWTELDYLHRL